MKPTKTTPLDARDSNSLKHEPNSKGLFVVLEMKAHAMSLTSLRFPIILHCKALHSILKHSPKLRKNMFQQFFLFEIIRFVLVCSPFVKLYC